MRYSGYNGTIIVEDDALVLLRSGVPAKLTGQSKEPYRRIPLRLVTGVELRPASRAVNGHLTVLTSSAPAPQLTVGTAPSHPDTVLFRWRDREAFAALHEWLQHVARTNSHHAAPAPTQDAAPAPTPNVGGGRSPATPARRSPAGSTSPRSAWRRKGRDARAEFPVLDRHEVMPAGAPIEVRWTPPPGWPDPAPQWWPTPVWMPADDWPGDGRGHEYWQVVAPIAAVHAAASNHARRPSDWRDRAPEAEWLRWEVSTVGQRLDVLNQLERTLASSRHDRRRWHDVETRNDELGVRVPDADPSFAVRERGWLDWVGYLSATRDWLLHAVVTDSEVPEGYFACREQLDERMEAYVATARAPEDRLAALEGSVLDRFTPDQRHRYWYGSGLATGIQESWQDAEELAATALRRCGFEDAQRTNPGADAGVDVVSPTVAAQVKYTAAPVGRPVLQQLQGAAGGRITAFFARAGYTSSAREYADQVGMALFTLALPATITPVNQTAAGMAGSRRPSR